MEDDQNRRRPKWKTTKMKDDQNGRRPKLKTTKMEDDQNGRRPRQRPRSINNWRFKADLRFAGFFYNIFKVKYLIYTLQNMFCIKWVNPKILFWHTDKKLKIVIVCEHISMTI